MRYLQPKRTTNFSVGSRIPAVIAVACFVAMAGCGEPTGPRTICCYTAPKPDQTVIALAALAAELHDAADFFAQGVENTTLRAKAELAVNGLADQLLTGKVAASRAALVQARSLIANPDEISAIELAPVSLALNHIERRMNQILSAIGYSG
jgi:hypothetical protein